MSAAQLVEKLSRRHPLQRLESPSRGFSGAFHVIGLWNFYAAFKFLVDNPNKVSIQTDNQQNDSYGWHFQYLTIIGLSTSTLCFLSGLLADITGSQALFKSKNYLAVVAGPIEVLISILYWGLRVIDPALVLPGDLPPLPPLNDYTFHLFPSLLLLLDYTLLSPPWPSSPQNPNVSIITFAISTSIAFAYWFWIELCYQHNGWYPYPIFGMLDTKQRIGLFGLSGAVMWVVAAGLRGIYAWVNGREVLGPDGGREKKRN